MNFTKQLHVILSSVVLFHILILFTAINLKPDIKHPKTLHLVEKVDFNYMKNNVLRKREISHEILCSA